MAPRALGPYPGDVPPGGETNPGGPIETGLPGDNGDNGQYAPGQTSAPGTLSGASGYGPQGTDSPVLISKGAARPVGQVAALLGLGAVALAVGLS
ncbi:hypothetical protein CDD83_4622 [Cordyceps sp. RAO-2017]|nr:hypothetical protein CDD83_4622 [Cordyceps sp. RAO-2017]